jgi:PIN domain nuclease of toxin-antitoxin system
MLAGIADTHTAIWYLFSDPRLGRAASEWIETAILNGDHIGISAISLAEMIYLIEKKRIPATALEDVLAAIANPKDCSSGGPVTQESS